MVEDDLRYPEWQVSLWRAVREPNPRRQVERIAAAETAIASRQGQLAESLAATDENIALQNGISTLQMLKRVALTRSYRIIFHPCRMGWGQSGRVSRDWGRDVSGFPPS